MDELRVTDEIVDDIKDSIECHLGWFSTKLKSDTSQNDIKKLAVKFTDQSRLTMIQQGT